MPDTQTPDGTQYEFTFDDGLCRFHLEWANEIPSNWRGVWPVVERFLEVADS